MGSISWDLILGGFALFMFGISFMGDGLKLMLLKEVLLLN